MKDSSRKEYLYVAFKPAEDGNGRARTHVIEVEIGAGKQTTHAGYLFRARSSRAVLFGKGNKTDGHLRVGADVPEVGVDSSLLQAFASNIEARKVKLSHPLLEDARPRRG